MRQLLFWPEKKLKQRLYKKYLLEKDIQMAIEENSMDRVIRLVPNHSRDVFLKELNRRRPDLAK